MGGSDLVWGALLTAAGALAAKVVDGWLGRQDSASRDATQLRRELRLENVALKAEMKVLRDQNAMQEARIEALEDENRALHRELGELRAEVRRLRPL